MRVCPSYQGQNILPNKIWKTSGGWCLFGVNAQGFDSVLIFNLPSLPNDLLLSSNPFWASYPVATLQISFNGAFDAVFEQLGNSDVRWSEQNFPRRFPTFSAFWFFLSETKSGGHLKKRVRGLAPRHSSSFEIRLQSVSTEKGSSIRVVWNRRMLCQRLSMVRFSIAVVSIPENDSITRLFYLDGISLLLNLYTQWHLTRLRATQVQGRDIPLSC